MGSRTKPIHGGSGLPHSRIGRPAPPLPKAVHYGPISSVDELERYLDAPKIACLLCGREFVGLGWHISKSHSMSPYDYKVKFNIPVTRSISGTGLIEMKKAITEKTWQDNPKMEDVRTSLKKNISNLDGYKHRTKSVLRDRNYVRRPKVHRVLINYRDRYIKTLKSAIGFQRNLQEQCAIDGYRPGNLRAFIHNNPLDGEVIGLFAQHKTVMVEVHEKSLTHAACDRCGTVFQRPPSHLKRTEGAVYCSRECTWFAKRNRMETNCVVCKTIMIQTPAMAKRVITCSKECSSIRRSKPRRKSHDTPSA